MSKSAGSAFSSFSLSLRHMPGRSACMNAHHLRLVGRSTVLPHTSCPRPVIPPKRHVPVAACRHAACRSASIVRTCPTWMRWWCNACKVKKGAALFRTGDPLRSLYTVRTGSFKTGIVSVDGREQVTGFQLSGDMLGLDAISDDAHACTAVALEDSEVCPSTSPIWRAWRVTFRRCSTTSRGC